MGLLGILISLGLLIFLAYRGWSILLLAPAAAVLAAGLAGEPLLAHWTQTFMGSAGRFIMQFFADFSPRCPVRQAHGRQRLGDGHRQLHDRATRRQAGGAGGGARRGSRHLWRR